MLEDDSSKNFFVLNVSYLGELATSMTFDGYKGIQSTNLMIVCYRSSKKRINQAMGARRTHKIWITETIIFKRYVKMYDF